MSVPTGRSFRSADTLSAYMPALRRYLRRRVPLDEVDDLAQDVCVSLEARKSAQQIENIESYLFAIAANLLSRRARRLARQSFLETDVEIAHLRDPAPGSDQQLADKQSLAMALAALEEMPERTRSIFVMHRFDERTYSAIARHMGISVSAVEKHIMIALDKLMRATGRRR